MQPLIWIHQNRKSKLYQLFLWTALAVSLLALWRISGVLIRTEYIPVDDYGQYWAAGRFNAAGENPYDPQKIAFIKSELTGQSTRGETVPIMWTPPWTLPLVMFTSLWDYPLSRIIWLLGAIAILLVSFNLIWKVYEGKDHLKWAAWIIGFSFGPTISVLEKGQITPIALLGLAGFIYWVEKAKPSRQSDLLAGACLLCTTAKPQLLLPFWIAILLWTFRRRRWWIPAGTAIALLLFSVIPLIFNPHVFTQYLAAVFNETPKDWATPTFGGYLRLIFGIDQFWLQFLGSIGGAAWVFFYWRAHRSNWQWTQALPWLVLISLLTAPYAWTYDQVLSTLPILFIAAALLTNPDRQQFFLLLGLLTGINLLDLYLHRFLDEFWFGWLSVAYLLWFLVAYRLIVRSQRLLLSGQNPTDS